IPAECVWIVVFPVVVPNKPRNVLVASLLAASMGPALYELSTALSMATPAALKLIRAEALASDHRAREAILRRFEREAQDTAKLSSTHTINIYDFGTTDEGDFYYVMELLDGLSLEHYVQLFGPMEAPRVVHLLGQ